MLNLLAQALFPARRYNKEKQLLHSRRWECHLERLRHAHAKLPAELAQSVLYDRGLMFEDLMARSELLQALQAQGLKSHEAESLIARHASSSLLLETFAFWSHLITSSEPARLAPLLPRQLVYHEVQLPLPGGVDPLDDRGAGGVPPVDCEQLMPVTKACKLPNAQKPKQARGTRKHNRRLHLCEQCDSYKQAVEFYVCCLHDAHRCCRQCMLKRPAEPFGEHLTEEQRTEPVLKLVDAILAALSERLFSHERAVYAPNRPRHAEATGAPAPPTASSPTAATAMPSPPSASVPAADAAEAGTADTSSCQPCGFDDADDTTEEPTSAAAGVGVGGGRRGAARPDAAAAGSVAVSALLMLLQLLGSVAGAGLQAARFVWVVGFRTALLVVAVVRGLAQTTAGAAVLACAAATVLIWPGVSLVGAGGVRVALSWLVAAVLLPMGACWLHSLCPGLAEAIAGDMERWAFQFASIRNMEQAREVVEQAREEVRRRARKARRQAAAAMKARLSAALATEEAEAAAAEPQSAAAVATDAEPSTCSMAASSQAPSSVSQRHHEAAPAAAAANAVVADHVSTDSVSTSPSAAGGTPPVADFPADLRVTMGVVGAVLLLSVMLVGAGGTLVLALWLVAAVLLPMGAGMLYSLCPVALEAIAGDMERWAFQFASIRNMEQAREVVEQAREEVRRRARKARRQAAAAMKALEKCERSAADGTEETEASAATSAQVLADALAETTAEASASAAPTKSSPPAPSLPASSADAANEQATTAAPQAPPSASTPNLPPSAASSSVDSVHGAAAGVCAPPRSSAQDTGAACRPLDVRLHPDGSMQLHTTIGEWQLTANRVASSDMDSQAAASRVPPAADADHTDGLTRLQPPAQLLSELLRGAPTLTAREAQLVEQMQHMMSAVQQLESKVDSLQQQQQETAKLHQVALESVVAISKVSEAPEAAGKSNGGAAQGASGPVAISAGVVTAESEQSSHMLREAHVTAGPALEEPPPETKHRPPVAGGVELPSSGSVDASSLSTQSPPAAQPEDGSPDHSPHTQAHAAESTPPPVADEPAISGESGGDVEGVSAGESIAVAADRASGLETEPEPCHEPVYEAGDEGLLDYYDDAEYDELHMGEGTFSEDGPFESES